MSKIPDIVEVRDLCKKGVYSAFVKDGVIYLKNDIDECVQIGICETGHWEYNPDGMDWGIGAWVCDHCKQKNDMLPTFIRMPEGKQNITHEQINPMRYAGSKYCPNCGIMMKG